MSGSPGRRRRGHITQLVEAMRPEPGSDTELDLEIEHQLGMEIDQALRALEREVAPADRTDLGS